MPMLQCGAHIALSLQCGDGGGGGSPNAEAGETYDINSSYCIVYKTLYIIFNII
jgi:hypothetical protein